MWEITMSTNIERQVIGNRMVAIKMEKSREVKKEE